MNIKELFKLLVVRDLVIVLCLAVAVSSGYYFIFSKPDEAGNTVADNLFGWKFPIVRFPITGPNDIAYSDIRDPGGIPEGLPVRLKIPVIGVDSAIEDALITPDGRMDVPAGSTNVAWFALGPNPGEIGSAVIGGHFGIRNGKKFVFYDLDKLKLGDKIYIEDDQGDTLAFQVKSIKLFDRNADATTVFTSNDGLAHLNLITCEGVWNRVNDTYPERRVVFAEAILPEGSVAVVKPTPVFVPPSSKVLSLGARGADVTALQTALQEKGFLTMPRGVTKGYFGSLTKTSLIKYQKSVGLPMTGTLNQATRDKIFPKQVVTATEPTLPSTAMPSAELTPSPTPTPAVPAPPQVFIQSVKSLFASPLDVFITSILVIAIGFAVFKLSHPIS